MDNWRRTVRETGDDSGRPVPDDWRQQSSQASQPVLLIAPERASTDAWRAELQSQGFAVDCESNPVLGIASARASGIGLIVVDVAGRPSGGAQVIRRLRDEGNPATILAITAAADVAAAIESIDSGADSCTDHACTPRELAARLRALIRRQRPSALSSNSSWTVG